MGKSKEMRTLIHLLIRWLREHGISESEIVDCLEFITRSK